MVIDPYPSATAAMAAMPKAPDAKYEVNPNRAVYLLPATSQFESEGSVTASNRSLQWREKVIEPLFESRSDQAIMYAFAQRLGIADQLLGKKDGRQNIRLRKVKDYEEPELEDVLRNEINRGCWTIGYTGQTPERLQAHMRNMHLFDVKTLRAPGGKDAVTGYDLTGDYFGLPWPCFGTPELKHPGTPNLYDTSKNVMQGGGNFRANFGVERDGVSLFAADGSASKGASLQVGYPEFDDVLLKKLGWWDEAHRRREEGGGRQELEDRPLRRNHPRGDEEPRLHAVRQRAREGARVELPRPDSDPPGAAVFAAAGPRREIPDLRRHQEFWRVPTLYRSIQQKNVADRISERYPLILTSGRIVEFEGGGEETRSNPWLAELVQENYVEINPQAAADRGHSQPRLRLGADADRRAPEGARQSDRDGRPRHRVHDVPLLGLVAGHRSPAYYPDGAHPIVRGEAINTGWTYGYDRVTMMQESKTTLCQVEKA